MGLSLVSVVKHLLDLPWKTVSDSIRKDTVAFTTFEQPIEVQTGLLFHLFLWDCQEEGRRLRRKRVSFSTMLFV